MLVPMVKVQVLGHRPHVDAVLECLYSAQQVHLVDVREDPQVDLMPAADQADGHAARQAALETAAARLEATLDLVGAEPDPVPGLPADPVPASVNVVVLGEALDAVAPRLAELTGRLDGLADERALLPRYVGPLEQLAPLIPELAGFGDEELRTLGLDTTALILDSADDTLVETLRTEFQAILGSRFELVWTRVSDEAIGCLLVFTHSDTERIHALLGQEHVRHLPLPSVYEGLSLHGAVDAMHRRIAELPAEIERAREELADAVHPHEEGWRIMLAGVRAELDQLAAAGGVGATDRAFALVGWVPRPQLGRLRETLSDPSLGPVVVDELSYERRDHTVPVLMHNVRLARPFAFLTRFFDTPRSGSIDPTALMALFLPLMFGVMVGDIVYGAVLLGLSLWLRRRFAGSSPVVADVSRIIVLGSVWSIVFGFLFGEALGNLGKDTFGDFSLWFYRGGSDALEPLLLFSLAIGAAHIVLGVVLGAWQARIDRDRHGLMDRGGTLLFLCGLFALAGYAADMLGDGALTPAIAATIVGFVVVVFAHGALGLIMGPLELLGTVGNILSYLRLAAVGLASVYLAVVANELAAFGPIWFGLIVATFFHVLNLALAAFSPLIQSLRLQYVEFFSKFFTGEGRDFKPFGTRPADALHSP